MAVLGWLALNACVALGVAVVSHRLLYGTGPSPKGTMNVVRLPFPTRTSTVLWSMWLGWCSIWIDYVSPTCRSPPSMGAMRRHLPCRDDEIVMRQGLDSSACVVVA
jgi:hypothetical protein